MKISFGSRFPLTSMKNTNGYGAATEQIVNSLNRLGYEMANNDKHADVEIWFDQPFHWKWSRDSIYRVGYHPWESTEMQKSWWRAMMYCHEIWTPSPIVADWYRTLGHPKVFVYEHGVDPVWTVKPRKPKDKIKFLHVGAEARRKGWYKADGSDQNVVKSFRDAFGDREDVQLTLKMNMLGMTKFDPYPSFNNVKIINKILPFDELVALYHDHDAFVYPSWGEGFGLNPLQAMATGMPTICTAAWAPYERLLIPDLKISSELVDSPWQKEHPGKMFKPDFDELTQIFRSVVDNFDKYSEDAVDLATKVKEEYSWDTLTSEAFSALEERLISQGRIG